MSSMDFFEQQDQAQRQTKKLVVLFILALCAIVLAVNAVLALIWLWTGGRHAAGAQHYPQGFFATNTLVTLALIGAGTLIEMMRLRDGGDVVAKMAGGRLVLSASHDLQERRLLNVVEEMALASGIACPKVYVLEREDAINAFAAGYHQNEAVVAVTRGALSRLTRDELQGVIGHEFSHILNGDMRLNIRLIGLLYGIQMIAGFGQYLMDFNWYGWRSRSSDDKDAPARTILPLIGFVLFGIGYIGIFFGRLIKSAVSREREFLADASAVQFTRNRDGIGGALRKIGGLSRTMASGSGIKHANAEQLSHLFLGAAKPALLGGWLATHPPVSERLYRIYGNHVELLDAPELASAYVSDSEQLPAIAYVAAGFAANASAAESGTVAPVPAAVGAAQACRLAPELDSALRNPQAAASVVYALLLGRGTEREAQMALLNNATPASASFVSFLAQSIARLPRSARLPLLDLAMPTLRQLAPAERATLLAMVGQLIAADHKISLAEFVLQTVLTRRLELGSGRAVPVRYGKVSALKTEIATLLSLVAHLTAAAANTTAASHFMCGAAQLPQLAYSASDVSAVVAIRFNLVKTALERINQLAPLAKPGVIKALLAAAGEAVTMSIGSADVLRAICTAIDAPMPPALAVWYDTPAFSMQ